MILLLLFSAFVVWMLLVVFFVGLARAAAMGDRAAQRSTLPRIITVERARTGDVRRLVL
jgi:hypothetical protein